MTRVAYCGNFAPPHSTENHVAQALDSLGHDVRRWQEGEGELGLLHSLRMVDAQRTEPPPDVVMWTRTASLADEQTMREVMRAAEARGIPTVAYHLDRWWGLSRQHDVYDSPFFRCTYVCTADGGHDAKWQQLGINHHWFPPAVSEFECVPGTPRDEYRSRVAFVGSWQHYGHAEWWPQRARMLAHVKDWYGYGDFFCWPRPGEPAVRGDALRDLYASVDVVVGDSCLAPAADGTPMTRYWSDRVPETLGRGGILVHPTVEGMPESLPIFGYPLGDMDALAYSIRLALSVADDPRQNAAARHAARADVLAGHTYTVRMRQLWKLLGL